jgi:hypothetical protein
VKSVAINRRERIIENLAVASALGFLALIVATLSLVADARAVAEERALLAPEGSTLAGRAGGPFFDRVYRIQGDSGQYYSMAISLRSPSGSALVAAHFTTKGELLELHLLGSCASRLPGSSKALLASFPGADAILSRAGDFARSLNGAGSEAKS